MWVRLTQKFLALLWYFLSSFLFLGGAVLCLILAIVQITFSEISLSLMYAGGTAVLFLIFGINLAIMESLEFRKRNKYFEYNQEQAEKQKLENNKILPDGNKNISKSNEQTIPLKGLSKEEQEIYNNKNKFHF